MKICFYSPYIPDSFGGGERHIFSIALAFQAAGHSCSMALPKEYKDRSAEIQHKYEKFLGTSLEWLSWTETPLGSSDSWFAKLWWTKQWDVLFYVTDGSLFFSLASQNHLHIQVPFTHSFTSIVDKIKLLNWSGHSNCNSVFTQSVIDRAWGIQPQVLYPSVDLNEFKNQVEWQNRDKKIVHVGRFFTQLHSKRQDVMIELFKQWYNHTPEAQDWSFTLLGSVEDQKYVDECKKQAVGYPISFILNASRQDVVRELSESKIYWHATGYDIDEVYTPEGVEHFGISTLEAMAAGCIPIVHNKGGQREILGVPDLTKLLWDTMQQAKQITSTIAQANSAEIEKLQLALRNRVVYFDQENFTKRVQALL